MPTRTVNNFNMYEIQNNNYIVPEMPFRGSKRNSIASEYNYINNKNSNDYYKPLSSGIIGFTAELVAAVIPCSGYNAKHPKTRYLPELLPFINKVCKKCRVDLRTMLYAIIYAKRFGEALECQGSSARGEYGTCHRIFLASLLLAKKAQDDDAVYFDNKQLAECTDGIWSVKDIEMMEKALASTIGYDFIVDEETIKRFVEEHRSELCWFH